MSARISSLPIAVAANIVDTDILPIVAGIASNTTITNRISVSELRKKIVGGGVLGPSADRGDVSVTLTVGTDLPVQQFATALTANRTVTLSSTSAYAGASFRIVRTGLGNFTLDVGGLKTIPAMTQAAALVMYDGAAWKFIGYELLAPLQYSVAYDPPSLADGAGATTSNIACTGARLGDFVIPAFSLDLQGITLTAWVGSVDTVLFRFQNESGGVVDLASGTLTARIIKP